MEQHLQVGVHVAGVALVYEAEHLGFAGGGLVQVQVDEHVRQHFGDFDFYGGWVLSTYPFTCLFD